MSYYNPNQPSSTGNELIIRNSKRSYLGFAVLFFLPTLIAIVILALNWVNGIFFTEQIFLTGLALFFLWLSISSIRHAFDTTPKIIVNNQGISNTRWDFGMIPWGDIDRIGLFRMGVTSNNLALYLKKPKKYHSKVRFGRFGQTGEKHSPIILSLLHLDTKVNEVCIYVANLEVAQETIDKVPNPNGSSYLS